MISNIPSSVPHTGVPGCLRSELRRGRSQISGGCQTPPEDLRSRISLRCRQKKDNDHQERNFSQGMKTMHWRHRPGWARIDYQVRTLELGRHVRNDVIRPYQAICTSILRVPARTCVWRSKGEGVVDRRGDERWSRGGGGSVLCTACEGWHIVHLGREVRVEDSYILQLVTVQVQLVLLKLVECR